MRYKNEKKFSWQTSKVSGADGWKFLMKKPILNIENAYFGGYYIVRLLHYSYLPRNWDTELTNKGGQNSGTLTRGQYIKYVYYSNF